MQTSKSIGIYDGLVWNIEMDTAFLHLTLPSYERADKADVYLVLKKTPSELTSK